MERLNLFIVGAQRSGSTSLYQYLKRHPNIFLSSPKEPHHFSTDLYEEALNFTKKRKVNKSKIKDYYKYVRDENYFSLFKDYNNEKYLGEASADYFFSKVAAKNIYNYNNQAKIIITLRNPAKQLYSWHLHLQKSFDWYDESFEETIKLEKKRKKGLAKYPKEIRRPSAIHYSDFINHNEQLGRYLKYFPEKQIKIVILERMKNNPKKTYIELIKFLGLKKINPPSFKQHNKYMGIRSNLMKKILTSYFIKNTQNILGNYFQYSLPTIYKRYFIGKNINKIIDKSKKKMIYKERAKPSLNNEIELKLKKKCNPFVVNLNKTINSYEFFKDEINLIKLWRYNNI